MRQTLVPGRELDFLTPAEAEALLARQEGPESYRVRAGATVALDAAGNGQDEVYTVPSGWEFEARRVALDLSTATDPSTGNVPLNVAGRSVEYLRSGTRIEYAAPGGPNAVPQVPGVQTWGAEQGPYLRNDEIFEVRAKGLTVGATLLVTVEGILSRRSRPRSSRRNGPT